MLLSDAAGHAWEQDPDDAHEHEVDEDPEHADDQHVGPHAGRLHADCSRMSWLPTPLCRPEHLGRRRRRRASLPRPRRAPTSIAAPVAGRMILRMVAVRESRRDCGHVTQPRAGCCGRRRRCSSASATSPAYAPRMISVLSPVPQTRIAIGISAITGNERNRSIVARPTTRPCVERASPGRAGRPTHDARSPGQQDHTARCAAAPARGRPRSPRGT